MPPILADATFWVAVVCFLVAQVAIVRAAFVVRGVETETAGGGAPRWRRGREVTWAVVPGVVMALVLYLTWRAVHPPPPPGTASAAGRAAAVTPYAGGRA